MSFSENTKIANDDFGKYLKINLCSVICRNRTCSLYNAPSRQTAKQTSDTPFVRCQWRLFISKFLYPLCLSHRFECFPAFFRHLVFFFSTFHPSICNKVEKKQETKWTFFKNFFGTSQLWTFNPLLYKLGLVPSIKFQSFGQKYQSRFDHDHAVRWKWNFDSFWHLVWANLKQHSGWTHMLTTELKELFCLLCL